MVLALQHFAKTLEGCLTFGQSPFKGLAFKTGVAHTGTQIRKTVSESQ